MLKTIIEKEARDLLSSTKFVASFAVCAALILLAFYVGATSYKISVAQYRASQAENLRQIEGLTDWLQLRQHRIFLPPQPLEALVTGISNDIGRTAEVRSRGEIVPEDSRYNEDPIFAVFRFLDLNFIFTIALSLFAILLGFDAISGEKERGTLKLSFSNAIPRATYILGKLLGSFITLATALLLALALGCLMLPLLGVSLSADEWLRLSMIILAGLLYFGAFLTLALFVSARTVRTSSSFLALLVVWIGASLISPRAATLLAGRAVSVASVDEIAAQKSTFARQLWKEFSEGMKQFRSPAGASEADMETVLQSFNQYMDSLTTIRDGKMSVFTERLNEERQNNQRRQQNLALNLARLSPTAALSLANAELAGTSLELQNRFYDEATVYRKQFNSFLNKKTGMNVGGRMFVMQVTDGEEEPEAIDATELPAFEYRAASLGESFERALVDIGILAVFNLLFFAGAFISFTRYDVR